MRLESAFVLFLVMTLASCATRDSIDLSSKDFHADAQAGVYSVSVKECELMMERQVVKNNSPIKCNRLKKIVFPYYPLFTETSNTREVNREEHLSSMGVLVVLDIVADEVFSLFNTLYQFQFPLYQVIPIEYFSEREKLKDDINNSYAFDSRLITRGTTWSEHAYGVAIDINPFQNPYFYVGENADALVIPQSAVSQYLNRAKYRPGKATRFGMAEEVVLEFAKHGFVIWGGDWDRPIDYMHFQVGSRAFIDKLTSLPVKRAKAWFHAYVVQMNMCLKTAKTIQGFSDQDLARKFCVEKVTTAFQ
ncbi:M15 family metallopeptidase [uncultured Shewanella sp.]|uniref:M15 family metallopeptidase n=1 Tax=uncultured Shewanella sp. TaxID=173975 RepID=UPI00260E03F6|nr:M15 family metallopeptidase [uncultured Shewanella sp.]